jgi:hypothetical protein
VDKMNVLIFTTVPWCLACIAVWSFILFACYDMKTLYHEYALYPTIAFFIIPLAYLHGRFDGFRANRDYGIRAAPSRSERENAGEAVSIHVAGSTKHSLTESRMTSTGSRILAGGPSL